MDDEQVKKLLGEFSEAMQALYGSDMVSLYRFGEGAAGNNHPGHHIKLLAVMREITRHQLSTYAGVHAKWLKKGIHAPLMLTEKTLETSTDAFPMEFLEMKESHVLLFGQDVLPSLRISLDNLKRQCEEQVKGKLIHLRQGYMETGGDKGALERLIAASIEPFTEVMRNVLRMKGKDAPVKKDTIISEFCKETGADDGPFMDALMLRRHALKLDKTELDELFERYLKELDSLAEKIDKIFA